MRAYVAITPSELQRFVAEGFFDAKNAVVVADGSENGTAATDDEEELEFEASWQAAEESRAHQGLGVGLGLVLAVDLVKEQVGQIDNEHVNLLSNVLWTQVQSLLLSESNEPELSWFAPGEIPTYLPQWLP